MKKNFKSLTDLQAAFPDEDACINHFRVLRWPEADKIACPWCGVIGAHYKLSNNTHKCSDCLKKFSVRHGTIFGDSKIPLRKWFVAIFLMTSHKKGISSCQLARDIGVTQKTAWFMLHRVRNAAMTQEFNAPLCGMVEIDEAYVGPKPRFQHANKRLPRQGNPTERGRKIVFGMTEKNGELRLAHIENTHNETLAPLILANIQRGSRVHTDESRNYFWMDTVYNRSLVAHTLGEYVRGDVTTNTIEGVFSHFKRAIVGTYHKASAKHLDR